jgi:hypothetical protein
MRAMPLIFLLGCPIADDKDCDASAAVSVSVTVEGPDDPTVTYIHEGVEQACDAWPDGTWACGYEVAGEITVRVVAEGWETFEQTVTVEQDECHVRQETVVAEMVDTVCTDIAVASVDVHVESTTGEPLTGLVVEWGYRDADMAPQPCEGEGADWICGWEVTGDLEIYVSADGHDSQIVPVHVPLDEDGCHPVGQSVDVLLVPSETDCTDVEVPSIAVTVAGSSGEDLTGVLVSWKSAYTDSLPEPCWGEGADWTCGSEQAGDFEVYASADGHEPEMQLVTVPLTADGCHVETQSIDFLLSWLPD